MLIEYRIGFDRGGVTITQRVDPVGSLGACQPAGVTVSERTVMLGSSFLQSTSTGSPARPAVKRLAAGGGEGDKTGSGGGEGDKTGSGGGEGDKTGSGGGGTFSQPVILFGPVVVGASSAPGAGGGEGDKTGSGGGEGDKTGSGGGEGDKTGSGGGAIGRQSRQR